MNKLQKDIIFYSNYCLHCNNLLNKLSKTILQNKIFFVCIDDQKIKIPKIITRVPSLYLVNDKNVLIENEIDIWVDNILKTMENKNKQEQLQKPISNMEGMANHPSQDTNNIDTSKKPKETVTDNIMAYHGNEMGGELSTNYSFLEDTNNSSLNNNFTFIGENNKNSINTPKDFNDNNQVKNELDQQFEKMMEARQSDPLSKGIQRI
tara:strand:- start:2932 stop:3552 length:621 start_codon:yes stop_codon:yes gene_type:complete